MNRLSLFPLLALLLLTSSCKKDNDNPVDTTPIVAYSLADLVGDWHGSYYLTVAADGKVSGGGVSATWTIDDKGKITGSGSYSYISGSQFIVASAVWSLQMSEDKKELTGTHDVMSSGMHDISVTLTRVTQPSGLTIVSFNETEVRLQWKDNNKDETSFSIERCPGLYGTYTVVGSAPSNATMYTDSFILMVDSLYFYRVRAILPNDTTAYSEVVYAILRFPEPSNLTITHISDNSVRLGWTDNSSIEKGFTIERATGTGAYSVLASVDSGVTNYTDNTVNTSNTYQYRVRAFTDHNFSKYSDGLPVSYQPGTVLLTLTAHTEAVTSVAYSPDGSLIASGSADNSVKIFDASTGSLLRSLTGHTWDVSCVAFSPDGLTLASTSYDDKIKLWKVSDGTLIRTISGHTNNVMSVCFSPDSQVIASGSWDNTIKIWRLSDGTVMRTLTGHTNSVYSVAYSPDGQTLASGSWDYKVKAWRVSDGALLTTLGNHNSFVYSVKFSPDGQTLASGSWDHTVKLWKTSDWSLIRSLTSGTSDVRSVGFRPDGALIACGGLDRAIRVWQVSDGTLLYTLRGHSHAVNGLCFSPNGERMVSGSYDNTIKIWSLTQSSWRENW